VVGGLDFRRGLGAANWPVMKQARGEGAADALVKKHKHGGDANSLVGEVVGVMLAHPLQQAVGFHLAQIIAELIAGVGLRGKSKGCSDGFSDLEGTPAVQLWSPVEQDFHEANHARVLDADARDLVLAGSDGQSQTLEQGKVDMDIEEFPLKIR